MCFKPGCYLLHDFVQVIESLRFAVFSPVNWRETYNSCMVIVKLRDIKDMILYLEHSNNPIHFCPYFHCSKNVCFLIADPQPQAGNIELFSERTHWTSSVNSPCEPGRNGNSQAPLKTVASGPKVCVAQAVLLEACMLKFEKYCSSERESHFKIFM